MYGRERGNQILFETEYELGSTPSEILKDSARELALRMHWIRLKSDKMEPILVTTMRDILLKAWGTYFTEVSNNIHEYSDPQEIEQEYDEFMEDLEKYFPKDKKNVFEAAGYMASNEQLKMIDELAGEVLKVIGFGIQLLPEPVKKVLENRVVQGLAKTSGGLTQIAAGCELCTTVVGSVQGIPMIALGTNMAFEGLQDLWYTLNGELDKESKNLIKEATGHKIDNIVELSEIGMSIYSGKVSSKKIAGKIGEESEKLGGLLKKIKKPASLATKTKRLVKKFLPKRHYRKFEVVDIEELAKKQGLKPNLQLFAEESMTRVGRWMSREEYDKMIKTGKVQESFSGTTHVANPASIDAFFKQAKPGSIYVEFDVPTTSLSQTKDIWAKILGPNTPEARLRQRKGLDVPQMPFAKNIKIVGEKNK